MNWRWLLPFLLGFITVHRGLWLLAYSYVSATNAVREGARCAAVGGTRTMRVSTRVNGASGGLGATTIMIPNAYTPNPPAVGGAVKVDSKLHIRLDIADRAHPWSWFHNKLHEKFEMRMETSADTKTRC